MREQDPANLEQPVPGILVLEDEALVARDIQARLRQLGFPVAGVAHTPEQAFAIAEQQRLLKAKQEFNDRLVEMTQVDDFA